MTCCYLCKSSFECSLKKGGVFVPLQDHFEQFCLTDNFINCNHFRESATVCGLNSPRFNTPSPTLLKSDRRFFARQKAEFPVTLSSYENEGEMLGTPDSNAVAETVDLAQGGMRVRSTKPLTQNGVLLFNFGEGFIAPLLHGLADVCWQKTNPEDGQWEAGLSFKDQFVKAIIAVQMSS